MKKRIIPALVAGTLVSTTAALPLAYAEDNDEKRQSTLAQRSEQMQGAVKDAWLDGKLETALLFNEHLNSFDIDTEVKDGVAHLNGAVESDIDRDLAGEIAESIDGIRDVKNKLVVDKAKASEARNDQDARDRSGFRQAVMNATVTARIKSELLVNTNTSGLAIDVDTRNGEVTLSGRVGSEQEKDLAAQIAENAAGGRPVNNRLTVKSEG